MISAVAPRLWHRNRASSAILIAVQHKVPADVFRAPRLALGRQLPLDADFCGGSCVRHPVDIAVMFLALWLLGSMVVDILTPKELTVYLIAAATGPAAFGTAICYWLRVPKVDFAMIITVFWLVAAMAIELISPVPLPDYMIPGALVPPMIVGAALHWHRYRLRRRADAERRSWLSGQKSGT